MNMEDPLFEDSEYLFMIQSFNIKLERVIERGYLKLFSSDVMDVRLGRSKINLFIQYHFPSTMNKMNSIDFLQVHMNQV